MLTLLLALACLPQQLPGIEDLLAGRTIRDEVVTPPPNAYDTLAAGGDHSCEITDTASLRCWGDDKENFLSTVPSGTFIDLDVEAGLGCALRESGSPVCWGRNDYGQTSTMPVESFRDIKTDWSFICGQRADLTLSCWGSDLDGRRDAPQEAFSSFDINYAYGCGVRASDGGITCWGDPVPRVTEAPTLGRYNKVTAGDYHACALAADGTIACWGEDALSPPQGSWSDLVSGFGYSCALDGAGAVSCWGSQAKVVSWTPYTDSDAFIDLAAGDYHMCGRTETGQLRCWGTNDLGQAKVPPHSAQPEVTEAPHPPPPPPSTTPDPKDVGTMAWLAGSWSGADGEGWTYDLRVSPDGEFTKWVWSKDGGGCLQAGQAHLDDLSLSLHFTVNECNEDFVDRVDTNPIVDPESWSFTVQMADYAVLYQRVGPAPAGEGKPQPPGLWLVGLWTGSDPDGWVYDLQVSPPASIEIDDMAFTEQVTQADGSSCTSMGSVRADPVSLHRTFASNECNPKLVGESTRRTVFNVSRGSFTVDMGSFEVNYLRVGQEAATRPPEAMLMVAGGQHTCFLSRDGLASCWGSSKDGADQPPAVTMTQLDIEDGFGCGVSPAGNIVCWGRNDYGQLKAPAGGGYQQVKVDWSFGCALNSEGELVCWGSDLDERTAHPSGSFQAFDVNYAYGCALDEEGEIACWGSNSTGQQEAPRGSWVAITTGDYHACALGKRGEVRCWGDDGDAKTTVPKGSYVQVAAAYDNTCALAKGGDLVCWGSDEYGQSSPPKGAENAARRMIMYYLHYLCLLAAEAPLWAPNRRGTAHLCSKSPPQGVSLSGY